MVKKKNNTVLEIEKGVEKFIKHPHLPRTWLHQKLKLNHRKHTGKVLPKKETSYGVLMLIFILSGWIFTILTTNALASSSISGSITVSGIVNGPAPTDAPIISRPFNGEKYSDSRVTVRGICSSGLFVEIYRNNIFAGTVLCSADAFEIEISLVAGLNSIKAKHIDSIGQHGPESNMVEVSYQQDSIVSTNDKPNDVNPVTVLPFTMITDSIYVGSHVRENLSLRLRWSGGVAPYAVVVDWGDGKSDIFSLNYAGDTEIKHAYQAAGTYGIRISASDSKGAKAFIQTAAIVSVEGAGTTKAKVSESNGFASVRMPENFYAVWRVYVFGISVVSVFWLGERVMYYKLSKHVDK